MLQQLIQIQQIQQQNSGVIELQHHFTGANSDSGGSGSKLQQWIKRSRSINCSSHHGPTSKSRNTIRSTFINCGSCIEFTSDRICNFIGIDFSGGSRRNSSNAWSPAAPPIEMDPPILAPAIKVTSDSRCKRTSNGSSFSKSKNSFSNSSRGCVSSDFKRSSFSDNSGTAAARSANNGANATAMAIQQLRKRWYSSAATDFSDAVAMSAAAVPELRPQQLLDMEQIHQAWLLSWTH